MFRGSDWVTVGRDGRVTLPARYRQAFGAGLIVTAGPEGQLVLFPPPAWDAVLRMSPGADTATRAAARLRLGNAQEVPLDAGGAFTLPAAMRERAALKGQALLLGQDDHLELWNPGRWEGNLDASIAWLNQVLPAILADLRQAED